MDDLKWTYNEFFAFLLIYISHVDMEFGDEEKEMIKKSVGEPTFSKMFDLFNDISDYKAYETILGYKDTYFPTKDKKNALLEKMRELFDADMDYNVMEKELLHFLDRMM